MADLQYYLDHARHTCGANCRVFRIFPDPSMEAPDLEVHRAEPPSLKDVRLLLLCVGCTVVGKTSTGLCGAHTDGYSIYARCTPSGWLLTGGPMSLLSYGIPDAMALERFPAVLASIQQHVRTLHGGHR